NVDDKGRAVGWIVSRVGASFQFVSVAYAVVIRVGKFGIRGNDPVDLRAVAQAITISVGVERVGAQGDLLAITQAIAIGVGFVGIGAVLILLEVGEPISVAVGGGEGRRAWLQRVFHLIPIRNAGGVRVQIEVNELDRMNADRPAVEVGEREGRGAGG